MRWPILKAFTKDAAEWRKSESSRPETGCRVHSRRTGDRCQTDPVPDLGVDFRQNLSAVGHVGDRVRLQAMLPGDVSLSTSTICTAVVRLFRKRVLAVNCPLAIFEVCVPQ